MIAQWITGVVLHVTDKDVVPVDHVEGTVGGELNVGGAEVAVRRSEEIMAGGCFPSRSLVLDLVLLDAEKPDRVREDEITLDLVGEMPRRDDFEPRGRTHALSLGDEVRSRGGLAAVGRLHRNREHPVHARARGVKEEILPPFIEDHPPGIRDRKLGGALELHALRAVAVKASIDGADRPVGGLDIGVEEDPLTHQYSS